MDLVFHPYDPGWVTNLRNGGADDYDIFPQRTVSDGQGNPCRHCLEFIPKDAGMLICAARPFPSKQAYAETGPIFLCEADCAPRYLAVLPPIIELNQSYLAKGYSDKYEIIYGTGKIVMGIDLETYSRSILEMDVVKFVDIRSAKNNCFQLRITAT